MYSKGILRALLEEGDYTIRMVELSSSGSNIEYIELEDGKTAFTAFLNERCLGNNTINKESTIKNAQWLIIREGYWDNLKKTHQDKSDESFYQEVIKSTEIELALVYLKGERVNVEITQYLNKITAGEVYLLLPFSNYPEKDRPYKSIRFVYLETPRIDYAYIEEPSAEETDLPRGSNKKLHIYGTQAKLHIRTHLIPDIRRRNSATLTASIYFINKKSERETVDSFDINIRARAIDYKKTITHSINIDLDWKNLDGGHQSQDQPRAYYVHLSYAQIKDENAESHIEELQNIKNYIYQTPESKAPKVKKIEYDSKDLEKWHTLNAKTQQFDALPMQKSIEVRWDTWQIILDKFEEDKTNKIAYVGDVFYTQREYDPCGFSKIIIQDKKDNTREAFTIFDEDVLTIGMRDKTETSFDIIAGDKRKEITITLDELNNKNVRCHGIMLAKGETHKEIERVFLMDKVYSVLKGEHGHIRRHDQTHTKQLEHTGTPITDENCIDTDVVRDPKKRHSEPDIIQNFRLNTDYKYIGENELQLNLRYLYNKTFGESLSFNNDLMDSLWMLNYIWLSKDMGQTYFVPISTCRYPNQIARVKVYPEMKWRMSLTFSDSKTPQSLSTSNMPAEVSYSKSNTDEKQPSIYQEQVKRARGASLKRKKGSSGYNLNISFINTTNGENTEFGEEVGTQIEKFVDIFVAIKETMDKVCYNDKNHAADTKKLIPRSKNIPVFIKFDYPSIRIDGEWSYAIQAKPNHNLVEPSGKISLGFFPLIKGTGGIDLIALALTSAHGIPVVGQILTALEIVETGAMLGASKLGYDVYRKIEFNVYAFAGINLQLEIPINAKDSIALKADGHLGVGVELIIAAGVTKKGVEFEADKVEDKKGIGLSVNAKAESRVSLGGKAGYEKGKGVFLEPIIGFGGVRLIVVMKITGEDEGKKRRQLSKPFWVVDPIPNILEPKRYYVYEV